MVSFYFHFTVKELGLKRMDSPKLNEILLKPDLFEWALPNSDLGSRQKYIFIINDLLDYKMTPPN